MMRYPLAHVTYDQYEIDAVVKCLNDGQTTCGKQVAEFENKFAAYVGRDNAIMVNSGSSADLLVAFGLGMGNGKEEILVPAVTWPTQVWSCLLAGYKVRLVDVDPHTLQFDCDDLERKINSHTKAIFPVHVLGNVGNMDFLLALANKNDLDVIEDCCEALGSTWRDKHVGTFGQAAAFSFFFSHLISTMEGGMVVTNSWSDSRLYRLWRSHGWEPKKNYRFWFTTWGFNIRPTELQGAFGCIQIDKIEHFRKSRQSNYDLLSTEIYNEWNIYLDDITILPGCRPAWHGFPVMVNKDAPFTRDDLCEYLDKHNIENRPIIAGNIARQPAVMNDSRVICGELPGADEVHNRGFYIGLPSFDDSNGTKYVIEVFDKFMHT